MPCWLGGEIGVYGRSVGNQAPGAVCWVRIAAGKSQSMVDGSAMSDLHLHTRSWHAADLGLAAWELEGDAFGVVIDLFDLLDFEFAGKEHGARE